MSLGKAKSSVKAGVKELTSIKGLKRVLVNLGIGTAIGAIVSLVITYIMMHFIEPALGGEANTRIVGFSIYPNMVDATTGTPYMHYDDVLLLIVTIMLLISKKLWLVVGFFLGWYSSRYLGLYSALGLPTPSTTP